MERVERLEITIFDSVIVRFYVINFYWCRII